MDVLAVFLLVIVIIMMLNHKGSLNNKIRELEFRIFELKEIIEKLKITRPPVTEDVKKAEASAPVITPPPPVAPVIPEPVVETPQPPVEAEIKPEPVTSPKVERQPEVIEDSFSIINRPVKTRDYEPIKPITSKPSFFERHPDLEKFIGENLVNKIGIAILVLAIGFFVKYAIDNDWIGLVGRVGIGIVCGGILIGVAHMLRNSYKAFSSVLVGGGLAVFYFTITLAFQQFHLFGQTTAFIILIVITIFAVVLSLLYDKQELAVIALVGGFASPFMVSNGSANYNGLFIYLLILNTGLLIIAYYKAWRILNIVSFGFTVIVFSTVLYTLTAATYHIGFTFASIFYALYFAINIANNVRENKKFIASDFSILLLNTGLYFATGLYLLTMMHDEQYRGLFCVSLAVVNLVLSYILFRNRKVDINILYLLIGITLTFISLAAPIQLHGHSITIFWASEAVLLYWLYQKSNINLMRYTSLLLWIAMLLSLLMDWEQIYGNTNVTLTVIANKGFITTLCAAVSSFLLAVLMFKDTTEATGRFKVDKRVFSITGLVLLYLSGLLEINHQFVTRFPYTDLNILYMMVYTPVFVFIYYVVSFKIAVINFTDNLKLGLLLACITIYLLLTPLFFNLQHVMLETGKVPAAHFMAHWVGAIFTGLLLYRVIALTRKNEKAGIITLFTWVLSVAVVVFLSLEVSLMSNLLFYNKVNSIDRIETVYIKTGLPILWGLLSFALMWLGMKHKQRAMRVASLTLFSITLLKLFLFDIKNIPIWGKIAAFFCLGILLLIVSFIYQKDKKNTATDEANKPE
ncbi:DUF2339 domain-containing protein [Mucilaginibacter rubeus]|uniref:DUF2339 domain-containing protein n=1 Tax=Mucilaginibacter rubeus TaxID=2027860 RepID=A0A5C1I6D8_9SPHI|nr:DUF2339 domain-containing protein [Mucilaginibacter rubeus]QEM13525.1 DUF2339 domain-containing protein [Mucilaginibacter rubeus]